MNEVLEFLNTTLVTVGNQPLRVGQLLFVPVLLVLGYLLARWGERLLTKRLKARNVDADAVQLIRRGFYILAIVLLAFTILDLLNVPLTAFAFVSGAIAIGVGFGAQNILNNFISGWIMMWERQIRIGDFVELAETTGKVEAINTRSTRIRRVDGVHVLVPNSYLLENTLVNWTLVDQLTRAKVRVGVAYGSPVRRVAELIEQAIQEHPDTLADPEPTVFFEDFGDNALVFDAYFWLQASAERGRRAVSSDIRFRLDELFAENDIVVAFPQRDVHIDGSILVSKERGDGPLSKPALQPE